MRRLAIKRLTKSDLTLFEWHLRNQDVGKQKSINLNADVFIDELYPDLPEASEESNGRIKIELSIFGPDGAGLHFLIRKIIKGKNYKNWRLNGEHIPENVKRYAKLKEEDLAVFEFFGVSEPEAATIVLLGSDLPGDRDLHEVLSSRVRNSSMARISISELESLIAHAKPTADHPINEFLLEGPLEDAAQRGIRGTERLQRRPIDRSELKRARKTADLVGRLGEELLNAYFEDEVAKGALLRLDWESDRNAVSPYDFLIKSATGEIRVDAKSTGGEFGRAIHISLAEIQEMASTGRYDIYRLYEVDRSGAKMRTCSDLRDFALQVLDGLRLPEGVTVDSISVNPDELDFGPEIIIREP